MRASLIPILACPGCGTAGLFDLAIDQRDEREVRAGTLTCRGCGRDFHIEDGIVDVMTDPPEHVRREAAGLDRFAEAMRNDGWDRDRILALPDVDHGYWWNQKQAFARIVDAMGAPGGRLLDVGSNTCWASSAFADRGFDVVALDISMADLQGLRSADHFLQSGHAHFERLLSTMGAPALADESFDYVFCSQVLHHSSPDELGNVLAQMFRIIRPGGSLLVANEPLRFLFRRKRDHGEEVADFEGNENVYHLHEYVLAARRAGFSVEILALRGVRRCLRAHTEELPDSAPLRTLQVAVRRFLPGRIALGVYRLGKFAWTYVLRGDAALAMVCTRGQAT